MVKCIQVIDMATNGTSDVSSLIRTYTTTTTISKINFGLSFTFVETSIKKYVESHSAVKAHTFDSHSQL